MFMWLPFLKQSNTIIKLFYIAAVFETAELIYL